MKIYKIRTEDFTWNEYDAFVVVANDEKGVLIKVWGTGRNWQHPKNYECSEVGEYTGIEKEPFILLRSFNAG